MRKNELVEIKKMEIASLKGKVGELRKQIADLVFDKGTKDLKDKKNIFKKRRDLAQVLTVLRQKQMLEELEKEAEESEAVMDKKGGKKT